MRERCFGIEADSMEHRGGLLGLMRHPDKDDAGMLGAENNEFVEPPTPLRAPSQPPTTQLQELAAAVGDVWDQGVHSGGPRPAASALPAIPNEPPECARLGQRGMDAASVVHHAWEARRWPDALQRTPTVPWHLASLIYYIPP